MSAWFQANLASVITWIIGAVIGSVGIGVVWGQVQENTKAVEEAQEAAEKTKAEMALQVESLRARLRPLELLVPTVQQIREDVTWIRDKLTDRTR